MQIIVSIVEVCCPFVVPLRTTEIFISSYISCKYLVVCLWVQLCAGWRMGWLCNIYVIVIYYTSYKPLQPDTATATTTQSQANIFLSEQSENS